MNTPTTDNFTRYFATLLWAAVHGFVLGALVFMGDPATIDGAEVPGDLACKSGEVIARNYHADTVECVHIGLLD